MNVNVYHQQEHNRNSLFTSHANTHTHQQTNICTENSFSFLFFYHFDEDLFPYKVWLCYLYIVFALAIVTIIIIKPCICKYRIVFHQVCIILWIHHEIIQCVFLGINTKPKKTNWHFFYFSLNIFFLFGPFYANTK